MDLTVKDAARLLQTSERAIYQWLRDGTLPSYRINEKIRLNRVELLEWATARNIKLSPEIFQPEQEPPTADLLTQSLRRGGVVYDVAAADKPAAIRAVCDQLKIPPGVSRDDLYGVLLAREALGSTAIGNGVAIPHPRSPLILGVKEPMITLAFLREPIDYGALDGRPVSILFTLISTTVRVHLQILSHLMFALQNAELARLLQTRAKAEQILATVERVERAIADKGKAAGVAQ